MANAVRGEYRLVVGNGSGTREYTLKWGTNAICEFEDRVGWRIPEFDTRANAGKIGMTEMRQMLWATLRKHHGPEFPTMDQVGDLMDEIGLERLPTIARELWEATNPDVPEGTAIGANPPTAQPGTGNGSISPPASSV